MAKETYEFDFSADDGNWAFLDANIAGGLLNVDYGGWGYRNVDSDWGTGAYDNFEVEVEARINEVDDDHQDWYHWVVRIRLNGDSKTINFYYIWGTQQIQIGYDGDVKAYQSIDLSDYDWHTVNIRRNGTIFYFSVDGGDEISWDYGSAKALIRIVLEEGWSIGDYDNFKYSWWTDEDFCFVT